MKKVSIIFSKDYGFQVIQLVSGNSIRATELANNMCNDGVFKKCGIEHYDVIEFDNVLELNIWILEMVSTTRTKKSNTPVKIS